MKRFFITITATSLLFMYCSNPADNNRTNNLSGSWIMVKKSVRNVHIVPEKPDTVSVDLLSDITSKPCGKQLPDTSGYNGPPADTEYLPLFITFDPDTMTFYLFPADPSVDTLHSGCYTADSGDYTITGDILSTLTHTSPVNVPLPSGSVTSISAALTFHYRISADTLILTHVQKDNDATSESLWYVQYYGPILPAR